MNDDKFIVYVIGSSKAEPIGISYYAVNGKPPSGFISGKDDSFKKMYQIHGKTQYVYLLDGCDMLDNNDDFTKMSTCSKGFIFVYSIRNIEKTIKFIREIHDKIASKRQGPLPCVVISNHTDEDMKLSLQNQEGNNLAKEWKCNFFQVSSKTGKNIDQAIVNLLETIIKPDNEPEKTNEEDGNGGCCSIF